jgi:hypothetical protein
MAELHRGAVAELHGRELKTFRNKHRSEFAAKARKAYLMQRSSKIPKVDFKKTYLRVNLTTFKTFLSIVINSIVILPPDPTQQAREHLQLSDEALSRTSTYLLLKKEIEHRHTSTKSQIQEWIRHGHLVRLFETYFDEHDEENIDDLCQYNHLERNLSFYQKCNPIPFKWMWIIYKDFRKETRPRQTMCDCCHYHNDEDDEPKLTFAQYFRDSSYEFYTQKTEHITYYYNITDFMRLAYHAILDVQPTPTVETIPTPAPTVETIPTPAPTVEMRPEPVCQVLLVSEEELLTKIAELKVKYPDQTSIKSLFKLLKHDKPEWQVTETRLKKLPKANKSSD